MSTVPTVTIGSLFSGIGGFDLGFEQAGLGPVIWQVEINPVCRRVLKNHFPGCSISEDIRECGAHNLAQVDIICGGFPCQDVSVAGKRAGIGGEQSGLFHEMVRIIDELKPAFAVWENVPGLGTSFSPVEPPPEPVEGGTWDVEEDSDFETVLRAFWDIGYFGAGRIFDAEYLGLAQRRERWFGVFSRGDIGAGRCAEILSIAEGLSWHPAPRRKTGEGIAAGVAPSLTGSGRGVERAGDSRGQDPVVACRTSRVGCEEGGGTSGLHLPEMRGGECGDVVADMRMVQRGTNGVSEPGAVTGAMSSKWAKGTGGPSGDEDQNLVAVAACSPPITGNQYGDHESREGLLVAHTLRAEGFDASEDGTGRGTPLIACYENHGQDSRVKDCGDLSPTIHAKCGTGGNNLPLVAFSCKTTETARATWPRHCGRNTGMVAYRTAGNCGPFETSDRTACMNTATDPNQTIIQTRMAVRRLTPRECERLQGFPDDWTATDADGKPISDSARYRMLGNAVAVPVARWIGKRMKRIHGTHTTEDT